MTTYHNDPALKAAFLSEIGKHEAADALRLSQELGIPLWLAYLEERVFEGLPIEQAKQWPRQLADALPVGVEIPDVVLARVLRWILAAERFGVRHATKDARAVAIIDRVVALLDRAITGDAPGAREWGVAARAAWGAGMAGAAWEVRAAFAACDAGRPGAARAARAAWGSWAAWVAGGSGGAETRGLFYPALRDYLLGLLREVK